MRRERERRRGKMEVGCWFDILEIWWRRRWGRGRMMGKTKLLMGFLKGKEGVE